jgi:tRNA G10  N-methylase Trm11
VAEVSILRVKISMQQNQNFLCIFSFGKFSLLELSRLQESPTFDFKILESSENSGLIECNLETAKRLARRSGGIYKVARICGESADDLLECLPLPDHSKFNWTVSGYACDTDLIEDTKTAVFEILKKGDVGKARFVRADSSDETTELKIADLSKNILTGDGGKRTSGLDVVVDRTLGRTRYGYTEFASDVEGLYERDFGRPFQDPTITMGTRLARTLVNLCSLDKGKTILDPFCGLGTILGEAMVCGFNVMGVEISFTQVGRCRENLDWVRSQYQISPKLSSKVVKADAMKLESLRLPKIDAIATEPILLPKLERNETAVRSAELIRYVSEEYRCALRAFSIILAPGGVVSIVTPELIDDRGKPHGIDLAQISQEYGFQLISSNLAGVENPATLPTTKRKIIQRKVYLLKRLAS